MVKSDLPESRKPQRGPKWLTLAYASGPIRSTQLYLSRSNFFFEEPGAVRYK